MVDCNADEYLLDILRIILAFIHLITCEVRVRVSKKSFSFTPLTVWSFLPLSSLQYLAASVPWSRNVEVALISIFPNGFVTLFNRAIKFYLPESQKEENWQEVSCRFRGRHQPKNRNTKCRGSPSQAGRYKNRKCWRLSWKIERPWIYLISSCSSFGIKVWHCLGCLVHFFLKICIVQNLMKSITYKRKYMTCWNILCRARIILWCPYRCCTGGNVLLQRNGPLIHLICPP